MKRILLVGVGIAGVAVMAIAPSNAADLGLPLSPQRGQYGFSRGRAATSEANRLGQGRQTVSIPNLGETTGVPALAVFRSVPLPGIRAGFSAAVRSAAIISSRPIG